MRLIEALELWIQESEAVYLRMFDSQSLQSASKIRFLLSPRAATEPAKIDSSTLNTLPVLLPAQENPRGRLRP